jgi:hypothetical protein
MERLREKDFSGALVLFDQALAVARTAGGDLSAALYGKAACLLALKQYNETAAACSMLLGGGNTGATFLTGKRKGRVFMMRSLSYFLMGRYNEAASDRAEAEKLGVTENAFRGEESRNGV